jgi:uncharacterized protein YjbJ (UPF0337 family)
VEGGRDRLTGMIRESYGNTRKVIGTQVDEWQSRRKDINPG